MSCTELPIDIEIMCYALYALETKKRKRALGVDGGIIYRMSS